MNVIRTLFLLGSLTSAVLTASALDNTINNDFWDTRAYVNPAPSEASAVTGSTLDAYGAFTVVSDILVVLDSSPIGLTLLFR